MGRGVTITYSRAIGCRYCWWLQGSLRLPLPPPPCTPWLFSSTLNNVLWNYLFSSNFFYLGSQSTYTFIWPQDWFKNIPLPMKDSWESLPPKLLSLLQYFRDEPCILFFPEALTHSFVVSAYTSFLLLKMKWQGLKESSKPQIDRLCPYYDKWQICNGVFMSCSASCFLPGQ